MGVTDEQASHRKRSLFRLFVANVLTTSALATGLFGALPDNPITQAFQQVMPDAIKTIVVEDFAPLIATVPPDSDSPDSKKKPGPVEVIRLLPRPHPSETLTPAPMLTLVPTPTKTMTVTLTKTGTATQTIVPTTTQTVTLSPTASITISPTYLPPWTPTPRPRPRKPSPGTGTP